MTSSRAQRRRPPPPLLELECAASQQPGRPSSSAGGAPNGQFSVAATSQCTAMSGQSGGQRARLLTLNEHLICRLCGGYFIDATTITECLHSFCKSCIVKYLENNKFCPVCHVQVHKNKPLTNIRPDQILQDIVYKLVPSCYQNEMRHRKEFYAKHPEEKTNVTSPEAKGEPDESYIYSPDESLSLSLEYYDPEGREETENAKQATSKPLPRRYLRCPAAVTVFHLQKLIRAKYGLSEAHRVDIMYEEESLCSSYTLMDIMYIYHWRRKVPLHLSYRIFESASKRMKLSDDNDEFKQSLSNSNIELESKEDEQGIKREWKEVQLKISETGVMSVTDISNLDTKKSTKVNEINQQSSLDQATPNASNVNKTVVKTEDKEPVKSCTAKSKKVQQDNANKKSEQLQTEKPSTVSLSAISASQSNSKSEEMKVKTIDQQDLSNNVLKTSNEKCESNNCTKSSLDPAQSSSCSEKSQAQSAQESQEKIKTEPPSTPDRSENKQNLTNNNVINNESKADASAKQNAKSGETKPVPSAGSKINALSAKLQFQPKVGQVNNTYSKKSTADKKATSSPSTKPIDVKSTKTSPKIEVKTEPIEPKVSVSSTPSSVSSPSRNCSQSSSTVASSAAITNVTTSSGPTESNAASSANLQQQTSTLTAPSTESLASIGLHVSTTMPSQINLNTWLIDRAASSSKNAPGKGASPEQQIRSLSGVPQIGKDIVCSTTTAGPVCSLGRFSIQTPSMSIYSISNVNTLKNNVYTSAAHSYTTPSKPTTSKSSFEVYPVVPPCPDAIPISLMKPGNARKEPGSKGTTLNEICAKISSGAGAGSKINDICAKIGESTKEKNKIEAQRGKPEVPDLLKISKKSPTNSVTNEIGSPVKHIPNIPNVPIYTPSSQAMTSGVEAKDTGKRLASVMDSSQAAIMQKIPAQKKHSQPVGYKTLRDPPKSWNPTLSKNNYVAAKNQAKELQNQAQASYGVNDGSGTSKQIPSKPAKIFKIRNMPRYLGNPASGVKPMYGVVNEQSKEKDQSSGSKNSPTMSMMKIDPQTLSPIVSSPNSPIVSPSPYSPTARSYQNSPFQRDICRNSSSPISPRNSPINMLSTNPFIPSHTPNTNPRLIYSHFPPGFPDASRFSNPLIRSPIGIPPPSAFHSSLPPSINKLYQRSSYMAQPQTSVPGFSPGGAGQPPTVQRIPPSSHSSPSPSATSPSASKSPKASSSITSPTVSANMNLARSEALTTTSAPSSMSIDSVALILAKGMAQRDLNVFDLRRAESSLKSSVTDGGARQNTPASMSQTSVSKSGDSGSKVKSLSSLDSTPKKPSAEAPAKQSNANAAGSPIQLDAKNSSTATAMTTKEQDKKDKNLAKINGGVAISMSSNEKPKDVTSTAQSNKAEKTSENKSDQGGSDNGKLPSSPSKSAASKTSTASEADKVNDVKQNTTQQKQEIDMASAAKIEGATAQGKKIVETQKGKAES